MITKKSKRLEDVIELGGKKLFLILSLCFLIHCNNKQNTSVIRGKTFITSSGIYFFNGRTLKLANIDGECYAFSLKTTKVDQILINADINKCFSKNIFWSLYIDEFENIWFYNSDYGNSFVYFSNNNYEKHDFVKEKIKLPTEFLKKVKKHLPNQ